MALGVEAGPQMTSECATVKLMMCLAYQVGGGAPGGARTAGRLRRAAPAALRPTGPAAAAPRRARPFCPTATPRTAPPRPRQDLPLGVPLAGEL